MVYSNRATGARNRVGRRELTFVRETDSWVLGDAWPRTEREERDWLYGADDLCEGDFITMSGECMKLKRSQLAWNDMSLSEAEANPKDATDEEGRQPAVGVQGVFENTMCNVYPTICNNPSLYPRDATRPPTPIGGPGWGIG